MTKIVFAWELGANYGHLTRDLPLANALRALGHDVWFAARDLQIAQAVLSPHGFPFVPSPRTLQPQRRGPLPNSYSHILAEQGFAESSTLHPAVTAWLSLWRAIRPQAIIADFAPTALLAARILSIPAVSVGAPFTIPPPVAPLPSIRPWEAISQAELQQADWSVLAAMNEVLNAHGRSPLERVADLYVDSIPQLTTFVELDYYAPRGVATYLGPISGEESNPGIHWTCGPEKKRVFAYLRASMAGTEPVLAALKRMPVELICVIADASATTIKRLQAEEIPVRNTQVDLDSLLPECDAVISYGGAGTIAQTLMQGTPLLLIPDALEQRLNTLQAVRLGAAIDLDSSRTLGVERCSDALNELLFNPRYKDRARSFQDKYSSFDNRDAIERGVAAIVQAMNV